MSTMTTGNNAANLYLYYVKKLLKVFDQTLQMYDLGVKTPMPQGFGTQAKWLQYVRLNAATTPLVEGVPPTETTLTTLNVVATVLQYGEFVKISDLLELTAIDPVVNSALDRLGRQASLTIDTLILNELGGSLPNQFANGKASLATTGVGDVMTAKEILKGVVTLKKNLITPHTGNDYVCVVSSPSAGDIMNDTNIGSWVDLNKYIPERGTDRPFNGELGKVYGCRILESQNIQSTTTGTLNGATVYANILLGEEPFGVVLLDGKSVQTFVKPTGSAGSADPINQVGTVGWKSVGFAAKYFGGLSIPGGGLTPDRGLQIRSGSAF